MTFLALLYADHAAIGDLQPDQRRAIVDGHLRFRADAQAAGVLLDGAALADPPDVVQVRSRDQLRTDGPFVEAKEQIGGYYVLDCPDLDTAVQWAGRIPDAPGQVVELRAVIA